MSLGSPRRSRANLRVSDSSTRFHDEEEKVQPASVSFSNPSTPRATPSGRTSSDSRTLVATSVPNKANQSSRGLRVDLQEKSHHSDSSPAPETQPAPTPSGTLETQLNQPERPHLVQSVNDVHPEWDQRTTNDDKPLSAELRNHSDVEESPTAAIIIFVLGFLIFPLW